jgi:hypothetical protein
MGNTCAQDCVALNYNRSTEATFDMNAEHTVPQYEKVKVLTSQANASDLPRLGLGAQSQESLPKRRPSASEDRPAEAIKVTFGVEEQCFPMVDFPTQPTFPVDHIPSKESVQPTRDDLAHSVQGEKTEDKEKVRDTPLVMEQQVEPVVQASEPKVEPSIEEPPVEATSPIEATSLENEAHGNSNSLALELVVDANGEKKIIQLHRRPLGAEFKKRMKGLTKIDKIRPHSYASELGMKVGWGIQSIGGEDVSERSYAEVQAALKNGMMVLPMHA